MGKSAQAIIKPELLVWARSTARLEPEQVAKKLHIKVEKLLAWEAGQLRPTIKQARKLARVYNQTFAAFYLPLPPQTVIPVPHDYRRQSGVILTTISSELVLDIRVALDRRSLILDLYSEQGISVPEFLAVTTIEANPEDIGRQIRRLIGINYEMQSTWRDPRVGFNKLREAVESSGVLVFQATDIPIRELRGYSLDETRLPVIVVNRKDSYAARSFTLLHELTHLMLRTSGLCDLTNDVKKAPEEKVVEVFCNYVAGAALIPEETLLREPVVINHGSSVEWSDSEIESLAQIYSASREAVVRRLSVLRLTTSEFYERKREQYQEELKNIPKSKGFVSPAIDVISSSGKVYVRTVLEAFYADRITSSDVSDYLGIKLKHLDKIADAIEIGAAGR